MKERSKIKNGSSFRMSVPLSKASTGNRTASASRAVESTPVAVAAPHLINASNRTPSKGVRRPSSSSNSRTQRTIHQKKTTDSAL